MPDVLITFTEASRVTGIRRQTLAAMPSLTSTAPREKLYGRVSLQRLVDLGLVREPPVAGKDAT
jgi:hypothetical protein